MSSRSQEDFEQRFQSAVSASLKKTVVPQALRERLLARLDEAPQKALPATLTNEVATEFEERLARAVHRSQDWAPEDRVVLETEAALTAESGKDMLSERSVQAIVDGLEAPEALLPEEKVRFLRDLRAEIARSSQELKAPDRVRQTVMAALSEESPKGKGQVLPFPSRAQWSRGVKALGSLAAAVALVFLTVFSSADAALANSVRADHKTCCKSARQKQPNGPPKGLSAMLKCKYGAVPSAPLDDSWKLRVSKMCQGDDGQPMVHLLYSRLVSDKEQTISFHFIPAKYAKCSVAKGEIKEISGGDFPVLGWTEGPWISTACSPELDVEDLRKELSQS